MSQVIRNRILLLALLFSVAFFIIAAPLFNWAIDQLYDKHFQERATVIERGLDRELNALDDQTRTTAMSGQLDRYIRADDPLTLISILRENKGDAEIDTFLVTDVQGRVITKTEAVERRGDFIYQTTSWGRALKRGESVSSIEPGLSWPLIMVAAYNIEQDGRFIGSLVGAHILNNQYAQDFKQRAELGEDHIAFYTPDRGVVGHSFGNSELQDKLLTYFNSTSEFVTEGVSGRKVNVGGANYIVKNLPRAGLEDREPVGGALIFVRYKPLYQHLTFALALALVFIISLHLLFRRYEPTGPARYELLSLITLLVILAGFFGSRYIVEQEIDWLVNPAHIIYNATLELEPEFAIFDRNEEHRITMKMFVGGETVNAVQAVVDFDPNMVRVEDVITTGSFCNQDLFIERSIDNEAGQVRVVCGVADGFNELSGTVAELVVVMLRDGHFEMEFSDESEVVAHDGLGTEVLRMASGGSYQAVDRQDEEVSSQLLVFSPTHPSSNRWYSGDQVKFTWSVLNDKNFTYRYAFDTNPNTVPGQDMATTTATSAEWMVEDDGVYYLHLAAIEDGEVRQLTHRQVLVDRTPPTEPEIRVSNRTVQRGEMVRFEFNPGTSMSGLQSTFYVQINDGMLMPVGPQLFMTFVARGTHTLTLRTYDNAGNFNESSIDIEVE